MAKRCGKIKDDGTACKAYRVKGLDTCHFHSEKGAESRAKGRKAISEDAKAVEESLKRLDLRSPGNQKKHLNHIIWTMLDNGESMANVARFYQMLIGITQDADTVGVIQITRTIIRPD